MEAVSADRSAKLLEAGLVLTSELSLPAVLQRIVELAADLTGARYGALGVLGPGGGLIDFVTTGVSAHQRARIGHLPVGRGILGILISDVRPLRLADIAGDPRSVGFPPNHPPMRSFLGAPVMARSQVFGNLYMTEKRGAAEFGAADEHTLVLLAAQAGVAIENARLYEEVQRRAERLEAVRELTDSMLAGADPAAALAMLAARARELVATDLAVVLTTTEDGSLRIRAADGFLAGHELAVDTLSRAVVAGGETAVASVPGEPGGAGPDGPTVIVPLRAADRPFGVLAVLRSAGRPSFSEQEVALVETFAGQAAIALEYTRAQSELRRLAVLEDRERIAAELHDGAIQALFAVGMRLQGAASLAADAEQRRRIEASVGEIDHTIRDLRNYIFGLRPGVLADQHLDQALRQLVDDFQQRTGVTTVADIDQGLAAELAPRAGDLVQLTREALSNVSRHAGAATCRVSLHRSGAGAVLEIDDDGTGFDPDSVSPGQGLGNLGARAERLGGRLELRSTEGEGTTVRIELPPPTS